MNFDSFRREEASIVCMHPHAAARIKPFLGGLPTYGAESAYEVVDGPENICSPILNGVT